MKTGNWAVPVAGGAVVCRVVSFLLVLCVAVFTDGAVEIVSAGSPDTTQTPEHFLFFGGSDVWRNPWRLSTQVFWHPIKGLPRMAWC